MFTVSDCLGIGLAALVCVPVLVLPGYALARWTGLLGFAVADANRRLWLALLAAYAMMPILVANLAMAVSLTAALVVVVCLAAVGAYGFRGESFPRPSPLAWRAGLGWLALVMLAWIDVAFDGALYFSLIAIDMVKHASVVRAIVDTGTVPPLDPFFARKGAANFYYFYFVPSALVKILGMGWIDQRAAVAGQIVWTGFAAFGAALITYERALLRIPNQVGGLLMALMAIGGLQLVLVAFMRLVFGVWIAQSVWSNEMVGSWLMSLLWVPHHVAGFIAAWTALLCLVEADHRAARQRWMMAGVAGLGLASSVGLSVWLALGGAAIAATLMCLDLRARRWSEVATALVVGAVSLLMALPFLLSFLSTRESGPFPLALHIRPFNLADGVLGLFGVGDSANVALRLTMYLVLLPLNYLIEFGLPLLGGLLFWRRRRAAGVPSGVGRLLLVAAGVALVIGTLVKSDILHNDLGWRVMLFAQLPLMLWTAHVLAPMWVRSDRRWFVDPERRLVGAGLAIAAGLGAAVMVYDLVSLRFHGVFGQPLGVGIVRKPAMDHDLRQAYVWLNSRAAAESIVQQNPDSARVFAHALYGQFRIGVADRESFLLGAKPSDVKNRIAELTPIFSERLTVADVAARARRHRIDVLVVTSSDPIWTEAGAWLTAVPSWFETRHVRVIRVAQIGGL